MAKKGTIIRLDGDKWLNSEKVQAMTDALQGIYLRLLIHMKKNEDAGIKANDGHICEKIRCTREDLEYLKLNVLFEDSGRYYQKTLKNDHETEKNKGKKKKQETKLSEEDRIHRERYIQRYFDFYTEQTGTDKPHLDGLQFEALDKMNKILKEAKAGNTNEKVLIAFDLIYKNWPNYPANMQNYIKPNQILYNLPSMMVIIKNGYKSIKGKEGHAKRILDQSSRLDEMISKMNNNGK